MNPTFYRRLLHSSMELLPFRIHMKKSNRSLLIIALKKGTIFIKNGS